MRGSTGDGGMSARVAPPAIGAEPVAAGNPHGARPAVRFRIAAGPAGIHPGRAGRLLAGLYAVPNKLAHPPPEPPPEPPAGHADLIATLAIALQRAMGYDMRRSGRLADGGDGRWIECAETRIGMAAVGAAARLAALAATDPAAADGDPADPARLAAAIDELVAGDLDLTPSPNRATITRAAHRLGIPVGPATGAPYWRLGTGAAARRFLNAVIDPEMQLSHLVQRNKALTSAVLREGGISVPESRAAGSPAEVRAAAREIGFPVVLKPLTEGRQRGVVVGIRDEAALGAAIGETAAYGWPVLVERHVEGRDYRFVLVEGALWMAVERRPPLVVGDGAASIAELVARENARPHRGRGHRFSFQPIDLAALDRSPRAPHRAAGMTPASVPAAGETVLLSRHFRHGEGGLAHPVPDLHPGYHAIFERMHALIPIPVMGVDLIAPDIAAPPVAGSYFVNEVNSHPAIHPALRGGPTEPKMPELIRRLVGDPASLRVPVVAVVTDGVAPDMTLAAAAALAPLGDVAVASRAGYRVGPMELSAADHASLAGTERALGDPGAQAIVVERGAAEVARAGLGIDWVDLLVMVPGAGVDPAAIWQTAGFLRGIAAQGSVTVEALPEPSPAHRAGPGHDTAVLRHGLPGGRPVPAHLAGHVREGADGRPELVGADGARPLALPEGAAGLRRTARLLAAEIARRLVREGDA